MDRPSCAPINSHKSAAHTGLETSTSFSPSAKKQKRVSISRASSLRSRCEHRSKNTLSASKLSPRSQSLIYLPRCLYTSNEFEFSRLKQFARHGGPDLGDLRGYTAPQRHNQDTTMSLYQSNSQRDGSKASASSSKTSITSGGQGKKISPYKREFEGILNGRGVYCHLFTGEEPQKPKNSEEILRYLRCRRGSCTKESSGIAAQEFVDTLDGPASEDSVIQAFRILTGKSKTIAKPGIGDFTKMQDLDERLTRPRSDWWDGSAREKFHPNVLTELSDFIEPSRDAQRPILPNFLAEFKSTQGNMEVLNNQGLYYGVLGARAMHEMRCYATSLGRAAAVDNEAYTIVATFQGGKIGAYLNFYTVHPTEPEKPEKALDDGLGYHMVQIEQLRLTGGIHRVLEGMNWLRNARDWAEKRREQVIKAANKTAEDLRERAAGQGAAVRPDLVESTDKLSNDQPIEDDAAAEESEDEFFDAPTTESGDSQRTIIHIEDDRIDLSFQQDDHVADVAESLPSGETADNRSGRKLRPRATAPNKRGRLTGPSGK